MSNSNPKADQTWAASLQRSDQTAQEKDTGPTAFDRIAAGLAGAAAFTGEFAKEQIHAAGQDLVSRILLGESFTPQQQTPEKELAQTDKEPDQGLDR